MEKRELAFELYKNSNGEKPLVEIAQEVGAAPGTVRGWKSRYKWDELIGKEPEQAQRNATEEKRSATRNVTASEKPKPVIDNDNLTEKQKLFCLYYLQHFNATKAYRQAYGCDYKTANANAYLLMVNHGIKKELDRLKNEMQQEIHVDTKQLLNKLLQQAHADITDFVDFEYSFVHLKNSDEVDGTMIQEVKKGKDGVSVKLYDGQKALLEVLKRLEVADSQAQGDDVKDWKQQVIEAANRRARENNE